MNSVAPVNRPSIGEIAKCARAPSSVRNLDGSCLPGLAPIEYFTSTSLPLHARWSMDPNTLAPLIPVVAILAYAGIKVARIVTPARSNTQDPETGARLAALEEELATVRRQLEEAHERLDFTERLLAQQHTDRLSPPT